MRLALNLLKARTQHQTRRWTKSYSTMELSKKKRRRKTGKELFNSRRSSTRERTELQVPLFQKEVLL